MERPKLTEVNLASLATWLGCIRPQMMRNAHLLTGDDSKFQIHFRQFAPSNDFLLLSPVHKPDHCYRKP